MAAHPRADLIATGYGEWAGHVLRGALEGNAGLSFTDEEVEELVASWLATPDVADADELAGFRAVLLASGEDPQEGDGLLRASGRWTAAPAAAALPTRAVGVETATLAPAARVQAVCVNLTASGLRIFRILTNRPARARLYDTTSHRAADAARSPGIDPTGNHGVLLDVVTTSMILDLTLSPAVDVHVADALPITIDNLDSVTGATTVTFHYIVTET